MPQTKEYFRDYYARNKERIAQYNRERYQRKKEEIDARNRKWAEANPTKKREISARYRENNRANYDKLLRIWHEGKYGRFRLLMAELKSDPCIDCGGRFHPAAMQFDHVRGEKRCNIAQMGHSSLEDILSEIAKCELVCANCHAVRTYTRGHSRRTSVTGDQAC